MQKRVTPKVSIPADTEFKASDAQKAAGLSYRQLNDWDARGTLPGDRSSESGWRKFSSRELFAMVLCSEIRNRFGTPVESLNWVKEFMLQDGTDHFKYAVETIARTGFSIWLLTDLKETFVMDSDLEFGDLCDMGYFRTGAVGGYILLEVNPLVNKLLRCLTTPIELERRKDMYKVVAQARYELTMQTPQEVELFQLLRNADLQAITIRLKNGEIDHIETDVDVEGRDGIIDEELVRQAVKNADYETITVKVHQGKITRLNRKSQHKLKKVAGQNRT